MIFVLLPLALLIAAIAVGFFIWAARTGQFDDLDTPAVRILFDDEEPACASSTMASSGAGMEAGPDGASAGQAAAPVGKVSGSFPPTIPVAGASFVPAQPPPDEAPAMTRRVSE